MFVLCITLTFSICVFNCGLSIFNKRILFLRALGMITYQMRFCSNFSEITAPLRELLHAGNGFRWDVRHNEAFDRIKAMLASAPVLAYFSPHKEIVCQCDCSQFGLGGVIMQEGKVVEYTSRALSKTEILYAQIEKELLSVAHCLSRWDTYVYGKHITVETDHKPLLAIHKKPLSAAETTTAHVVAVTVLRL